MQGSSRADEGLNRADAGLMQGSSGAGEVLNRADAGLKQGIIRLVKV